MGIEAIRMVLLSEITIPPGRRALRGVAELAASIAGPAGLLHPIAITPDKTLISGLHRIKACESLGWKEIPAIMLDLDEVDRQLAEIDENICRNELTALESAEALAKRKQLYLAKHPETARGVAGAIAKHSATAESAIAAVPSFADDTAKKTGKAPRTVRQEVQIATAIAPDVRERLHDTVAADDKTGLTRIAGMPEEQQRKVAEKIEGGAKNVAAAIRETQREVVKERLDEQAALPLAEVGGLYDVLVIDPPWEMQKIDRDDRPLQVGLDYATMTEAEIAAVKLPAADDCHVWLWTTQHHLQTAFRLLEAWGLKYVCTFVWHKPGGFQPVGLPQFNCEFALYARKGSPIFQDTKAFSTCFEAPRGEHSEKPEEFYAMVRRVTAGRRLDMYNRRKIEGFDGWGREAAV